MLDHLADLESDFSVFHRVDDMYALSAPEFFRKGLRLRFYPGALQHRVRQVLRQREDAEPQEQAVMAGDPELAGLVDFE